MGGVEGGREGAVELSPKRLCRYGKHVGAVFFEPEPLAVNKASVPLRIHEGDKGGVEGRVVPVEVQEGFEKNLIPCGSGKAGSADDRRRGVLGNFGKIISAGKVTCLHIGDGKAGKAPFSQNFAHSRGHVKFFHSRGHLPPPFARQQIPDFILPKTPRRYSPEKFSMRETCQKIVMLKYKYLYEG